MKVSFKYKGKKFKIDARKCSRFSFGLMFRGRDTKPCVFEFRKPVNFKITSLFVFFPFLVVWLNEKNKVVDKKIVRPFTFSVKSKKSFSKFLEIPLNGKNKNLEKFFQNI